MFSWLDLSYCDGCNEFTPTGLEIDGHRCVEICNICESVKDELQEEMSEQTKYSG